ncbi:hypothetical protein [Anaeromyxobacter oryzae]|uniref:Transposase n=1 Tax=Anaeromyxobacter oryzae TaxID=2918170 RepID=A0ABM7WRQ0_9BACT|nr:hypothetical protein [Anaeromyxobacter oryzae]BDG02126.1 hypothetical protein AMOR_11220 [Anaeromyxobacter oryzae]
MPDLDPLARLEADGLVHTGPGGPRTTRRWQGAMARAAVRLYQAGAPWRDLRLPVAAALLEVYGDASDDELAGLVEAILPLEEVAPGRPALADPPTADPAETDPAPR